MDDLENIVAGGDKRVNRWVNVTAVPQASEAADTQSECDAKWSKIYRLFGASGEAAQDEVFAAVNMYFLRNGTSPAGKYSKPIVTGGGVSASAGAVVAITGKNEGEVRQFMRGRLLDSYTFLKNNRGAYDDPDIVAKAQNAGIPKRQSWLIADWLGDNCPYFVGDEANFYRAYRASTIALANARRRSALAPVDRVVESAPESHVVGPSPHRDYDTGGLY